MYACQKSDRDQTRTEETVGLTEIFLLQDHFVTHREEVKHVQLLCYNSISYQVNAVSVLFISHETDLSLLKNV